METILGVVVDELPYLENPLVETPTTVNTYRSALISAMSRADRVVLTRPGAELVAENVITVPIPCQPFVVEHLGKKHGEEQPALASRKEPREAGQTDSFVALENYEVRLDVRVLTNRVRVGVVARVLAHPPGVADTDNEVGHDATEELIELARLEDLAVREFVGDERILREDDAQRARNEKGVPGVRQQCEAKPRADHRDRDHGEGGKVETSTPTKEPFGAHSAQHLGELGERVSDPSRSGLGETNGLTGLYESQLASMA